MKTIVIYASKTGYTRQYAEWIRDALGCDLKEASSIRSGDFKEYDTVIYGGGLYAGGVNQIRLIKDHFDQLKEKNLVVWATGLSPERAETSEQVWNQNFSPEQQEKIQAFYLRGGFDFGKLGIRDQILMRMFKIMIKNKSKHKDSGDVEAEDMAGILKSFDTPVNFCCRESIDPLVKYVRSL